MYMGRCAGLGVAYARYFEDQAMNTRAFVSASMKSMRIVTPSVNFFPPKADHAQYAIRFLDGADHLYYRQCTFLFVNLQPADQRREVI